MNELFRGDVLNWKLRCYERYWDYWIKSSTKLMIFLFYHHHHQTLLGQNLHQNRQNDKCSAFELLIQIIKDSNYLNLYSAFFLSKTLSKTLPSCVVWNEGKWYLTLKTKFKQWYSNEVEWNEERNWLKNELHTILLHSQIYNYIHFAHLSTR